MKILVNAVRLHYTIDTYYINLQVLTSLLSPDSSFAVGQRCLRLQGLQRGQRPARQGEEDLRAHAHKSDGAIRQGKGRVYCTNVLKKTKLRVRLSFSTRSGWASTTFAPP